MSSQPRHAIDDALTPRDPAHPVSRLLRAGLVLGLVIALGWALLLGSMGGGQEVTPDGTAESPEAGLVLLEPASLEGLPRPFTHLHVRVLAPGAVRSGVSVNGVPCARSGDSHHTVQPVPLPRNRGFLKFDVEVWQREGLRRFAYCRPCSCLVEASHDEWMRLKLAELESPLDAVASGALLALAECVDMEHVGYLCSRLIASGDPRSRRRIAMLLGHWRLPDAAPSLFAVLRTEPTPEVRRACRDALEAVGPYDSPSRPTYGMGTEIDASTVRELELWLEPLLPHLRAERFPAACD